MESSTHKKPSASPLIKKLTQISEEAQRTANARLDEAGAKSSLGKFTTLIKELHDASKPFQGPRAMELRNAILLEIRRLEKLSQSPEPILSNTTQISDLIFPTVMTIAGALKFFMSADDNPADDRSDPSSSLKDEQDASQPLRRTRSQLTVDIMTFAKSCSNTITCLKSQEVGRKPLIQQVTSILNSVKNLITDESFAHVISKAHMALFVETVKELRALEMDTLNGHPIIAKFLQTLQPMAADVKRAAFELQKEKPHTEKQVSSSQFVSASEIQSENQPLGYQHDVAMAPLHIAIRKSNSNNSLSDSQSRESVFSNSMQSNSTLSRRRPESPWNSQDRNKTSPRVHSTLSQSAPDLPSPTSSNTDVSRYTTLNYNRDIQFLHTVDATCVDVIDEQKFVATIEVAFLSQDTGKPTNRQVLFRSDAQILRLWTQVNALLPGSFVRLSFEKKIKYSPKGADGFLSECSSFFHALNQKTHILKSHVVLSFLHDSDSSNDVLMSPTSSNTEDSDTNYDIDVTFITLSVARSDKKHAVYTADEYSVLKNNARKGGIFGMKRISANKDGKSLSVDSLTSKSSSGWDTTKSTKTIFTGSTSSLLGFANRLSDNGSEKSAKRGSVVRIVTSLHLLEGEKISDRHKFKEYCAPLLKAGYIKVDEDTVIMKDPTGSALITITNANGKARIDSAPLDEIISAVLADAGGQYDFFECFVLTHRHLMKPHELLIRLIEKYRNVTAFGHGPAEAGQMQVSSFINKWIETSYRDFDRDENLRQSLEKFVGIIRGSKKISLMADQISSTIAKQLNILEAEKQLEVKKTGNNLITNVGTAEFLSLDPFTLAVQMTKIDFELLSKVRAISLVDYLWEKDHQPAVVNAMINRFNLVCYWVGTEICTTPLLKKRIQVVENMIKLLRYLKEINNYNGMMAVISGLNMASTKRLAKTWAGINSKIITQLHDLEKIMDPQMNYQNYRDIENRLRGQQSCIPFFGLFLKDLTFANDGNPKYLVSGLVNFSKNWTIYDICKRFIAFGEISYDFITDDSAYDYCSKLIALPEKRLYSYSLLCEPKTNTKTPTNPRDADSTMRLIEKWSSSK